MFAQAVLALLVARQDFPRALDDRRWKTRQAGDIDSVALVGASGNHFTEKKDTTFSLFDRDVVVSDARQKLPQLRQLVVVSGKKRLGADVGEEMFDHRPGERKSVEG